MKRRDFIKKGSAIVVTTVLARGLVSCGGGDGSTPTPVKPNPGATPKPAPEPTLPVNTSPVTVTKTLYITDGFITQADASDSVDVYFKGFSASKDELNVPGEGLIVYQGDTVEMTIVNTLKTPHKFTIAGITDADSGVIPAGEEVTFSFTVDKPGTYIYQDSTSINRLLGLHGGFAILPAASKTELFSGSRTFVQQLFWIFNDIDPGWNDAVFKNTTLPVDFVPCYFTLNGLGGKPPAPVGNAVASDDSHNPAKDSMHDPRTMLVGGVGDRTLIRAINVGMAKHSMHIHANHMEWLRQDGQTLAGAMKTEPNAFEKDVIPLNSEGGTCDVIYPFDAPPDSVPTFNRQTIVDAENEGRKIAYPMHLHDEMTQTSNGGSYMYGAMTDIFYKSTSVTNK
jgi:FtsP/CotA-like multicopper oxidase with cupredoxin domain